MSFEEKIKNAEKTYWVTDNISSWEVKSKEINAKISAFIALSRKEIGLTRAEFANKIGIPQYIVAKYESLDYDFTISDLCKISQVIDITDYIKDNINNQI